MFGYFDYQLDGFTIVDHPIPYDQSLTTNVKFLTFTEDEIHMWVPRDYKRQVGLQLISLDRPE
jgi:hypothetical protein